MKSFIYKGCMMLLICLAGGCKQLIELDPPKTKMNKDVVYDSDATAIAVMNEAYARIDAYTNLKAGGGDMLGVSSVFTGLLADELDLFSSSSAVRTEIYKNTYTFLNDLVKDTWADMYKLIFISNSVLENIAQAVALTPAVKKQLQGEAYFLRALCLFHLVNLYGDIPVPVTTDYTVNTVLPKKTKAAVWEHLIGDLRTARTLLSKEYLDATLLSPSEERVRPSYWSATALLSRSLLYTEKWAGADSAATELIAHTALFGLGALEDAFKKNNREAIWQLWPVHSNNYESNTREGYIFILPAGGPDETWPFYLNNAIYGLFEADDDRKTEWIGAVTSRGITYHYPFKYKIGEGDHPVQEYSTLFRLSEQYLIRAEARVHLGREPGAKLDLDAVRHRAGLGDSPAAGTEALLDAIAKERITELFTEGHRWYDLKRTRTIDEVMPDAAEHKGSTWESYRQLLPLPALELQRNPRLQPQNTGY